MFRYSGRLEMSSKRDDLFSIINFLYEKVGQFPEDSAVISKLWIINRFLSMDSVLFGAVAHASRFLFTLGPSYYKLFYRLIPRTSRGYYKYHKIPKEFDSELLSRYSSYFGLSLRETTQNLRIMQKNNSLEDIYKFVGLELKK